METHVSGVSVVEDLAKLIGYTYNTMNFSDTFLGVHRFCEFDCKALQSLHTYIYHALQLYNVIAVIGLLRE